MMVVLPLLQPLRDSVFYWLWDVIYIHTPHTEHILPINFISNTWVVVIWICCASALRKSNRNFIMVSPLSGPANPDFKGWLSSRLHSERAIFFDHISFIAPLTGSLRLLTATLYQPRAIGFHSAASIWTRTRLSPVLLTLTLIHIKAIWTANSSAPDFTSSLHQWDFTLDSVF